MKNLNRKNDNRMLYTKTLNEKLLEGIIKKLVQFIIT